MENTHNYLERIAYLVYFFFETQEEANGDGHSVLINLINPTPGKLKLAQLRSVILNGFIREQTPRLGMTEATIATANWLQSGGFSPSDVSDDLEQLRRICSRYEHPFCETHSLYERQVRRSLRLVRLLWLMHAHRVGKHSRAVQFFFADHEILIGRSVDAPVSGYHPEHVVPCAYIRDKVIERFAARNLVSQDQEDKVYARELAQLVQRLMAVAHISKDEAGNLDKGKTAMKTGMPKDWDPDTGDILDRLRDGARIKGFIPVM